MALKWMRGTVKMPLLSPGGTRTHNLQVGIPVLYPVELRVFSTTRLASHFGAHKGVVSNFRPLAGTGAGAFARKISEIRPVFEQVRRGADS